MSRRWFDAHLDLAYLAAAGRDMEAQPEVAGGPDLPAAVTFPSLREGRVEAALATIFIEPVPPESAASSFGVIGYPSGDAEAAHRAGLRQLDLYHSWAHKGWLELGLSVRREPALPVPGQPGRLERESAGASESSSSPRIGILIEGADCVRTPDELEWWVRRGVVAVGLAWVRPSRYAAGNGIDPSADFGLTPQGRALVRVMDETPVDGRSVVHDASHLSDRALQQLFELTDEPVIASHSNCRALIARKPMRPEAIPEALREHKDPAPLVLQRHLSDDSIREIARRGGVVGLNVFSPFIIEGGTRERRATVDEWCAHADHVCQLLGHHKAVALGSDMDGGFSALRMPAGVDRPRDLELLAQGLARRGWSEEGVDALAWGNWARFWSL